MFESFNHERSHEEVPVQILDRQVRRLRTKDVASVKVLWRNQFVEEEISISLRIRTKCRSRQDVVSPLAVLPEQPSEPVIEWSSSLAVPMGHFISYLKARKLVSKGCIYHLVRVNDSSVETRPFQSASIIREFPEVFPDDLHGIPLEREIDFGIDIIPDICPISFSPYRMALAELK
ncbi:hypothetical protein MTR67_030595 [Solanum verrucosum]|uniref:Uncharacterized protein n=1 Tax=Solanum verrucosum TaxID=315347 RepID=A0AAF0U0S3_SOLVR|nr:hypothetical protein MTR67_030595 [Solanum verrucosum]